MGHLGEEPGFTALGAAAALRAAADLLAWSVRVKRARRLSSDDYGDLQVDFRYLRLPDGTARQLRAAAGKHGVKVGDLLVHALAETVHQVMPPAHRRRPDIAIGTIRDTRSLDRVPDFERFGMRLSFANVICPADCVEDRDRLLARIAAEHRRHRSPAARHARFMEMRLALATGRLLGRQRLLEFYRKRLPLSAGVSNVDLSQSWVAREHPGEIAEFFRISPLGPTLPIVVTPTTLGEQFNLAVTWRRQVFPTARAERFIDVFVSSLLSWTQS
jgi:hypothetical protein